jgi:PhnB protein
MANVSLTEQLDQAVQTLFGAGVAMPPLDATVAPLLATASRLRDLPREEFQQRLKKDLEMSTSTKNRAEQASEAELEASVSVNAVRAGFRTVTPYLVVPNVHEEIAFINQVFAGEGQIHGLGSAGGFHSEYKIGDSMLMIGGGGEGSTWQGTPVPATLHIYVEDVDAVYERALQAGATDFHPPQDQVYGERSAAFRDVGGNQWYPATYIGAHHIPEGLHNLMPYLHPRGAAKQMDFLKEAFGAEEVVRGESPDGVIYHAQVRIGNAIVEMGEAHDQWQPSPAQFMLYVDDVDAWYARAMRAEGAVSLGVPSDQPYGARVGTVKDPFDNTWYLATPTEIRDMAGRSSAEGTT